MAPLGTVKTVLNWYGIRTPDQSIRSLGNAGGFSGSDLWRIEGPALSAPLGPLCLPRCLRRWPAEHPSRNQLIWIHGILRHATEHGFSKIPVPIAGRDGETTFWCEGRLWELTPWLPGAADYERQPTREKLSAAMKALAAFHSAVEDAAAAPRRTVPPCLAQRRAQLAEFSARPPVLERHLHAAPWVEIREFAREFLPVASRIMDDVCRQLDALGPIESRVQPCIRDIWHDHVLFIGNEVSGIIDFGAMRVDSPAGDVARLLGSMAGNDQAAWEAGIAAYEGVRVMTAEEQRMLPVLDHATVVLSGLNWLWWLCVENRRFENKQGVLKRLAAVQQRIRALPSVRLEA